MIFLAHLIMHLMVDGRSSFWGARFGVVKLGTADRDSAVDGGDQRFTNNSGWNKKTRCISILFLKPSISQHCSMSFRYPEIPDEAGLSARSSLASIATG